MNTPASIAGLNLKQSEASKMLIRPSHAINVIANAPTVKFHFSMPLVTDAAWSTVAAAAVQEVLAVLASRNNHEDL